MTEFTQIFQNVSGKDLQRDYIELTLPFESPIDLYIRFKDIRNINNYVYFIGYRMGKEKVTFWGVYQSDTGDVILEQGCRDIKFQLSAFIKQWKLNGFMHAGSNQKNRITGRISFLLGSGSESMESVIRKLLAIAWMRNEITAEELLGNKDVKIDKDYLYDFSIMAEKDAERNEISVDMMLDIYEEQLNPPTTKRDTQTVAIPGAVMETAVEGKDTEWWKFRPIWFYEDYVKLKTNIDMYQGYLNPRKYPYPQATYQRFLTDIARLAPEGVPEGEYVQFLYDQVVIPYEKQINLITIDREFAQLLTPDSDMFLTEVIYALRHYLEKVDIIRAFRDPCPPSITACEEEGGEIPKGCDVYYYGSKVLYSGDFSLA